MQFQPPARDAEADRERLRAIHATLTAGDVAAAGTMAAAALAEGIEHPMVLDLAAGRLEQAGRPDEALKLLLRAKKLAPQAPGIRNAVGLCLNRLGRPDQAIAEFDGALALDPGFAPALSNRATSLVALARLNEARRDFEAALALDEGNFVALGGMAALALQRGDAAEAAALARRVLDRAPGFPDALMTLAGAEIAEGRSGSAEARLIALLADPGLPPLERALAHGLLGDALDAQRRFADAFAAYREGNRLRQTHHRPEYAGRQTTLGLVRELTGHLRGKSVPKSTASAGAGPARRHVFLVGFPRSGTTLLEQALEQHPDVTTLAEKECLVDGARALMTNAARFEAFCRLPDAQLEPYRAAYWERVRQEGVDPAGRVFVDKHPFNSWKLPLIARLFPGARVLFARRDPRDTVLSCFRHRFQMSDPIYQMLTLGGAAELFAATMEFAEASANAFGLEVLPCPLEAIVADFDGETRRICDHIGLEWTEALRDFAVRVGDRGVFTPSAAQLAQGLNARGVGKWRDYEAQMAPVMPLLAPWVERFGYA
jgi:tetratricopeptide (TPR) repeat protein